MHLGAPLFFGIVAALAARNKGYKWYHWILSLGLIGMIVIFLMPDAKRPGLSEEERIKILKRGELTGGILSLVSILLVLGLIFISYKAQQH